MEKLIFRVRKDRIFKWAIWVLALIPMVPLLLILFQIFRNGFPAINFKFFTHLPKPPGENGGGILNALLGTFMLILIAFVFSVPIGVMAGIFLSEVRNKFSSVVRILVNLLQGVPSIVIGILAYIWIVIPLYHFSAISGGIALSLMMLPIVARSTEGTLKLIPHSLKEASYALGINYTRTIFKVILPSGFGGIASGIIIGVSRIAGETAPLLFTAFGNPFLNLNPLKPVGSLPLLIFNYAMSPYQSWHRIAWGASFILVSFILVLNIAVKILVERWKTQS